MTVGGSKAEGVAWVRSGEAVAVTVPVRALDGVDFAVAVTVAVGVDDLTGTGVAEAVGVAEAPAGVAVSTGGLDAASTRLSKDIRVQSKKVATITAGRTHFMWPDFEAHSRSTKLGRKRAS